MKNKPSKNRPNGQALVEFVLVLPFLLILFLGMVEAGYAMYDYIVLANANREGVRLAARGRFDDEVLSERVIGTGGFRNGDANTPNLNLEENFGMIITHIPFPSNPSDNWASNTGTARCCQPDCVPPDPPPEIYMTICVQGVTTDGAEMRELAGTDSSITAIVQEFQNNVDVTSLINKLRVDNDFDAQMNEIVIVETFMAHSMLLHLPEFVPFDDPMNLYFRSAMRVTLNSRTQTQ